MDFRVLGPLEAVEGTRVVCARANREGLLLADLLVHRGVVVPAARLIEDLWRGNPPPGAAATLPTYVRNLRNLLQPGRRPGGAGGLILTRESGYVLAANPGQIDANRFEGLVAEGRQALGSGDATVAADGLRAALRLWRGPAYGEAAGEAFARAEAARLEELRVVAVEARVDAELALGRHAELAGELEALVEEFPFRERLWGQLMVALYRADRQAESLRAYSRLRRLLNEELGIEPTKALRDLEQDILLQRQVGPPGGAEGAGDSKAGRTARAGHRAPALPAAVTPFVGRAAELEEVARQLRGCRLLTLTGAGGVGKTRLAVEAASQAAPHYPDGVWMLELAPVSDEAAIPSALAALLGVRPDGTGDFEGVEALVCSALANRRVLLVLDNCEHVAGAVARLAHSLLTACPAASVMATSRTLLGVPGETAWTVPPMNLPAPGPADVREMLGADAVVFFCERAQAARPGFRLNPANAEAVSGICHRLDGIPLALELAAARVRLLTAQQIDVRLADCFTLLSHGPRTAEPRHRTLQGALDWSYALLSDDEQAALRQLSVFPGHFDLGAAAAVLAGGETRPPTGPGDSRGLDLLTLLVDKSLVTVDPRDETIRYRLLEPIRQYAGAKLSEAGETDATRDRHRDWFLRRAREFGSSPLSGLAHGHRYLPDQVNYQAALEWSWQQGNLDAVLYLVDAHLTAWLWRRDPRDRQRLEQVLAEPGSPEHPVRPLLLAALAFLSHDSDPDPEREERLMGQASALARRIGDPRVMATVDFGFAELQLALGNTARARSLMESALSGCERSGYPASVGWCHDHLGWVAVAESDYRRAHHHFQQAADLAQRGEGDQWLAAHALAALAPLAVLVEDPERGRQLAEDAIAEARRWDSPGLLDMALTRAAEAQILGGDRERAARILVELLHLLGNVPSRRWLADTLEMTALVLESEAEPRRAAEILGASRALRAASGEPPGGGRPVAAELARSRDRLLIVLGPADLEESQARGRELTPEAAIARATQYLAAAFPPPTGPTPTGPTPTSRVAAGEE